MNIDCENINSMLIYNLDFILNYIIKNNYVTLQKFIINNIKINLKLSILTILLLFVESLINDI